jgi:hypothetical protein
MLTVTKDYSTNQNGFEVLQTYNENVRVVWQGFQTPGFISNRDFVYLSTKHSPNSSDHSIIISSCSIDREDCPPKKGYVRAKLLLSGFVIKPVDDNSCDVDYLVHADIGGL